MVDDTWRIDVELLADKPEAENAAKYWSYRAGTWGKITWEHKPSVIFGVDTPSEAAARAAEYVVATFVGPACPRCGESPVGIVVTSRTSASAKRTSRAGVLCTACQESIAAEAAKHRD